MNLFARSLAALVAIVVLLLGRQLPAQPAAADQPLVVSAFSGIDAVLDDVSKVLTAIDAKQELEMLLAMSKQYTAGIDTKRPWGSIVTARDGAPHSLGFIPITSLEMLLANPQLKMAIGEPEELENGVLQFQTPAQPMFAKVQNGWAFVSDSSEGLASLPDNPVALLDGLETKYDMASKVYVQRVPESMRQMILDGLGGAGAAPAFEPDGGPLDEFDDGEDVGEDNDPFGIGRAFSDIGKQIVEGAFEQIDEITYGVSIEGDKRAVIDITATVVDSSPAARRLAALETVTSDHSGLLMKGSIISLHSALPLLSEDAAALSQMVEWARAWGAKMEDLDDAEDAQEREKLKREQELAELSLRLISTTLASGKLDGGFTVTLKPGASFVAYGGTAGDAAALRKVMIEIVREAQKEAGVGDDKYQRQQYEGYSLVIVDGIKAESLQQHTDQPSSEDEDELPEFDVDKYFGEEMQIVLALKDNHHYLAMGSGCVDAVKNLIDNSLAGADQPALPLTLAFGTRAFMEMAQSEEGLDADPELVKKILAIPGDDRVMIRVAPAGKGATLRIELERLPLLGAVVAALSEMNAPAAPFEEAEDEPGF